MKHNIAIFDLRQGVQTFPNWSMQLKPEHNLQTQQPTPLLAETTFTLQPGETLLMASRVPQLIDHDATGIVTPSAHLGDHDTLFLVSSLCTINNNAVGYRISNFSKLPYKITTDAQFVDFLVSTPKQMNFIKPMNTLTLTIIMHQHTKDTEVYLNELFKVNNKTKLNSTKESEDDLFEIYKNAPDKYIIETPDNTKNEPPNSLYDPETQQLPKKTIATLPNDQLEPPQTIETSETSIESASRQKLPLKDNKIQNRLTINKKTDTSMLLLSANLTLKNERQM